MEYIDGMFIGVMICLTFGILGAYITEIKYLGIRNKKGDIKIPKCFDKRDR